jgi:GTP cyclohydrolase I
MTKEKTNPTTGRLINTVLIAAGIETPLLRPKEFGTSISTNAYDEIGEAYESILFNLGLDQNDDSLSGTPGRIAKMYTEEIFRGLNYDNFPECTTVENKMNHDELVEVSGIEVRSMCEHHFLPFVGHATVGYIPGPKILGLSKFARVVDFFCRRPQIQERLTEQVSFALQTILGTEDVAVVIQADHYCMRLRGVQSTSAITTTSKMAGRFRNVPELRAEFLRLRRH